MREYITATTEFNQLDAPVCAPLFQRTFDWNAKTGRLEISVVGLYRIWVNGKEITKGWLAPYFSNPDQVVYYDEYDVTDLLKATGNTILVLLGNGFVNTISHGGWEFEDAPYRSAPKFYLGLYDGETRMLTTDEDWTVYNSPILFDDYRNGEWCDARREETLFANGRKPLVAAAPTGLYKKCVHHTTPRCDNRRTKWANRTPSNFRPSSAHAFRRRTSPNKIWVQSGRAPFQSPNARG